MNKFISFQETFFQYVQTIFSDRDFCSESPCAVDKLHTLHQWKATGLRPVSAKALEKHGITVPADQVDDAGNTHPRLSTLPMGFLAAPSIAQGAHESVLYGAEGTGSDEARALAPVLNPASRLSSRRQPEIGTPASGTARDRHRRRFVLSASTEAHRA